MTSEKRVKHIVEAALLAAGGPLTIDMLLELFLEEERPEKKALREAIGTLQQEYQDRGIELVEVGSGFRINVRAELAPWVSRLWEERPARYSRAMLETLALIAYRQPITRGEIEEIRGVSVSSQIIKTMMEREWIRVVGHRDVPGKPALYATTRGFLDYFGMSSLSDLPTLQEIRDLDSINRELELAVPSTEISAGQAAAEADDGEVPEEAEESVAGGVNEPEMRYSEDDGRVH
ncbi:MAG: SMC-Scp complex subunit ScpB [Gammaproteobacteria bacterium]|nr:SMC-Scp complex subunit ScpB [Gammaproteobacteria bacterium]